MSSNKEKLSVCLALLGILTWQAGTGCQGQSNTGLDKSLPDPAKNALQPPAASSQEQGGQAAKAGGNYCLETKVLPLPGKLNETACFNSNSPELVNSAGILLSTAGSQGEKKPESHLDYIFKGRFNYFSHHVARNESSDAERTLYIALLAYNPGKKSATLRTLSGASYLSQPDAPFISLPDCADNGNGSYFAGPGDRVALDLLRAVKAPFLADKYQVGAAEKKLLFVLPIPVKGLQPALNGRSTLIEFDSDEPLHLAELAAFGTSKEAPPPEEFLRLLSESNLAGPRESAPTVPGQKGAIKYGRVAGVQIGTVWSGEQRLFKISEPGSFSLPIATVERGTFASGQIQSAPLRRRYPDTAFLANGNYGIKYDLKFKFANQSLKNLSLQIFFQTPLKADDDASKICFLNAAPPRAFFRGTVKISQGSKERFLHLVQKQGVEGSLLSDFDLAPGQKKQLRLEFFYPADATPPQMLTVKSFLREPGLN